MIILHHINYTFPLTPNCPLPPLSHKSQSSLGTSLFSSILSYNNNLLCVTFIFGGYSKKKKKIKIKTKLQL